MVAGTTTRAAVPHKVRALLAAPRWRDLAWIVALALSPVVVAVAGPRFGFASIMGESVLSTIEAVVTAFAAAVAVVYVDAVPTQASKILVVALVYRATAAIVVSVSPALLGLSDASSVWTAELVTSFLGAVLLMCAAVAPSSAIHVVRRRRITVSAAGLAIATAGVGAGLGALWPQLSGQYDTGRMHDIVAQPDLVLIISVATAIIFVSAADSFSLRDRTRCLSALALSCVLGALSQVDALISGDARSFVSFGDLLAAASALALGVWAVAELTRTGKVKWQHAAQRERQRLARELHDNVAQDLAFIVRQTRFLRDVWPSEPRLSYIAAAAEQALEDSRSVISTLRADGPRSLSAAVTVRARQLTARARLKLTLDVTDDVITSSAVEHEVMSILREAMSNIERHAGATGVAVSLRRCRDVAVLKISDDGQGFDPAVAAENPGVGLWSMRERARTLGSELNVVSSPGDGVAIELAVPLRDPSLETPAL